MQLGENIYLHTHRNKTSQIQNKKNWVPVAHAYNLSYSGGRDQEDHSSKPALCKLSMRPYLEKSLHKNRAGGVTQGEGRVQAPVPQKKKKKRKIIQFFTVNIICYFYLKDFMNNKTLFD
jgi:hypothetical protein